MAQEYLPAPSNIRLADLMKEHDISQPELAKISSSSQKRVVVSVCDSEKVDLAYLADRIAAATELIAAVLHRDEEGKLYATYEINKKARPFLRQPCKDMVDAMCEMINEEG